MIYAVSGVAAIGFALMIVFLELRLAVAIIVAGMFCIALVRFPEVGLVFYVASISLVDPLIDEFGLPEGLRALPLAIMIAVSLAIHLIREKKWIGIREVYALPLSFLLLLLVGFLWTKAPGYGLHKIQAFVLYNMLAFFGVVVFAGEKKRLRRMVSAGVYLGLIFCPLNLFYLITGGEIWGWRQFSFLGFSPIDLGRSIGFFAVSFLIAMFATESRFKQGIFVCAIGLLIFFMYNTASRGPTLALVVASLAYFGGIQRRPLWQRILLIGLFGVAIYGLFFYIPFEAQTRYINMVRGEDAELNELLLGSRAYIFSVAMEAIRSHPFMGVGTGGYAFFCGAGDVKLYPHNFVLEMVSEFGVLGAALTGLFFLANAVFILRVIKKYWTTGAENLHLVWGVLIFIYSVTNSMVSGDITSNIQVWFASAYLWASWKTEETSGNKLLPGTLQGTGPGDIHRV